MGKAIIASSVRTPVGKANRGLLRETRPDELGQIALTGAVARVNGLEATSIDDILAGCAFPEGVQGMNVAQIIGQRAGLAPGISGATVNRLCASGLQAIAMACMSVDAGQANVIAAGGVESMSMVSMGGAHYAPNPELVSCHPGSYATMGNTAENVAAKYEISREDQDAFALRSHEKALRAQKDGSFADELVTVQGEHKGYRDGAAYSEAFSLTADEGPRRGGSLEALAKLRPVFRAGGSVTAGNASQMSDGAAFSIVMDEEHARELGVAPLARLLGFAVAGVAPEMMGIGPVVAVPKALKQTGLSLADIGLIELNEAFASQSLAVIRELGLDEQIVNVNGGAIALGHPLGCTGAKLTATLLHEMKRRQVRFGMVTMCVGGGMGAAGIFENLAL